MKKSKLIISMMALTILTASSVYATERRIIIMDEVLNDGVQAEIVTSLMRSSEQLTYGNLVYELQDNNTIAITGTTTKDIVELIIPEKIGDYLVTTIENHAFEDCRNLTNVDLGKIEDISFDAFKGCTALERITIPNTIKNGSISPIFEGCTKLKTITLEEGMSVVPARLCASTPIESIKIPESVTKIEDHAFEDCRNLTDVDLGKIEDISFGAFKGCTALERITIPNTIKNGSISPIFEGCTKLKTITLEEGMTVVPSYICASTPIESIKIPESITKIEHYALEDCTNLTDVDLGKIESISFGAFKGCTALERITIPNTIKNGSISPIFEGCTKLKAITLEEGMSVVPARLCASTPIESIKIPESVTTIEEHAFENCRNLTDVDLGKIEDISFGAFKGCTALERITIPKTIKTGGSISPIFEGCTKLKTITLEEEMTVVPSYICASTPIESIKIPESVTQIEHHAFEDCKSLLEINLEKVEKIGEHAFSGCKALTSVTIPETVKEGSSLNPVFDHCENLTKITLEEGITVVPGGLCASTNITSIEIPSTVIKIGAHAFKDCKNLLSIIIPESVTNIGWTNLYPNTDTVFEDHSEELTIYCYEGSKAQEYAVNMNIKYSLLKRDIIINNYQYSGKYIYIQPDTTVTKFLQNVTSEKEIELSTKNNLKISNSDKMVTGVKLTLGDETEERYIIIVKGDINYDGKVDFLNDIVVLNNYRLGLIKLSDEAVLAGNTNLDDKIDFINDIVKINNYRLNRINSL